MISEDSTTAKSISQKKMSKREKKLGAVQILCAQCGTPFSPSITQTTICPSCIMVKNDITEGITKEAVINFCRNCKRYLRPPWVYCEHESKELLSICLSKVRGLSHVKLLNAQFRWTEPHSKRLRVELTIQKDVGVDISLKQTFEVEYIVHYMQCDACKMEFTPHTWKAMVQVRQRAAHKKTFLYLEQLMLKQRIHEKTVKIMEERDGLNFFFPRKNDAMSLMSFLESNVPFKKKMSRELVSHDIHTSCYNYKYSFLFEMPKVCKDDLIIMPKKMCREFGGVNALAVCYKVNNRIRCYDPVTLRIFDINAETYYKYEAELDVIAFRSREQDFLIVDVDEDKEKATTFIQTNLTKTFANIELKFASLQVQRANCDEDTTYMIDCHFGAIMNHGDNALGYLIKDLYIYEDLQMMSHQSRVPDIIMIRKHYPDKLKKRRNKMWDLKRMHIVKEDWGNKKTEKGEKLDMEELREELEQNKRMRKNVNIYANEKGIKEVENEKKKAALRQGDMNDEDSSIEDDDEMVQLTEMIRQMDIKPKTKETQAKEMNEMIEGMEGLAKKMEKEVQ